MEKGKKCLKCQSNDSLQPAHKTIGKQVVSLQCMVDEVAILQPVEDPTPQQVDVL